MSKRHTGHRHALSRDFRRLTTALLGEQLLLFCIETIGIADNLTKVGFSEQSDHQLVHPRRKVCARSITSSYSCFVRTLGLRQTCRNSPQVGAMLAKRMSSRKMWHRLLRDAETHRDQWVLRALASGSRTRLFSGSLRSAPRAPTPATNLPEQVDTSQQGSSASAIQSPTAMRMVRPQTAMLTEPAHLCAGRHTGGPTGVRLGMAWGGSCGFTGGRVAGGSSRSSRSVASRGGGMAVTVRDRIRRGRGGGSARVCGFRGGTPGGLRDRRVHTRKHRRSLPTSSEGPADAS